MEWILLGSIVLALVVAVCCGALVEVFRQLDEVRTVLKLDDQPRAISLKKNVNLIDVGLPQGVHALPEAAVIFLSSTCATCLAIAESFRGGSPQTVWFVVAAHKKHRLLRPLKSSFDRVINDPEGRIAARLGLDIVPSVLTTRFGGIAQAHAVASSRQVLRLIPTTHIAGLDSELSTAAEPAIAETRKFFG